MEDICPQRCSNKGGDKTWSKNELLGLSMKEIRKSRVSLIYNSQVGVSDIDSRIRSKVQMFFYLFGSKYDDRSPISKGAIQSLKLGSAWVDFGHSQFGRFHFKPYLPRGKQYVIFPRGEPVVSL